MSASYIRKNDYSAYKLKPYELPYQAALKELSAKTQYWEQGARQAYSAYKQMTDLAPTMGKNKKALKQFVDQANNEFKKVINSDLTVSQNAMQAQNVLKPLYDPENEISQEILYDDQLTRHYAEQEKIVEEAKQSGEGYNIDNENYLALQRKKFIEDANNPNASAREHYAKKRSYIPYYDYTQEMNTILKECKEDSVETQQPDKGTGYMLNSSKSGVSKTKLKGCLDAALSPNAKQQMSISGIVSYGGNNQRLLGDYVNYQKENIGAIRKEIVAVNAQLEAAKISGKYTKEQLKDLSKQAIDFVESRKTVIRTAEEGLNKIKSGDMAEFEKNAEGIAGQLFTKNKINTYANAFTYSKVVEKYIKDPVQMDVWNKQFQQSIRGGAGSGGSDGKEASSVFMYDQNGQIIKDNSYEVVIPVDQAAEHVKKEVKVIVKKLDTAAVENQKFIYNKFITRAKHNPDIHKEMFFPDGKPRFNYKSFAKSEYLEKYLTAESAKNDRDVQLFFIENQRIIREKTAIAAMRKKAFLSADAKGGSDIDVYNNYHKYMSGALMKMTQWRAPEKQDPDIIKTISSQIPKNKNGLKPIVKYFNDKNEMIVYIPPGGDKEEGIEIEKIKALGLGRTVEEYPAAGADHYLIKGVTTGKYATSNPGQSLTPSDLVIISGFELGLDDPNSMIAKAEPGSTITEVPYALSISNQIKNYTIRQVKEISGSIVYEIVDDKGHVHSRQPTATIAVQLMKTIEKSKLK